ncbi:hypothetical protein D6V26_20070 [Vibrio cholerae]|nr:hypothetical protein [Vibrio cholerae]
MKKFIIIQNTLIVILMNVHLVKVIILILMNGDITKKQMSLLFIGTVKIAKKNLKLNIILLINRRNY